MKKLIALLLIISTFAILVSCTGGSKTPVDSQTPAPTEQPTQSPDPTQEPEATEEPVEEPAPSEEPVQQAWQPEVTEVTDADKIADFDEAIIGDKEQGPVWFYLSDEGKGYQELYYTEMWGDNWQYSSAPQADDVYFSIFDEQGFKVWAGTWGQDNIQIVIGWRAYADGTAKIGQWDYTTYDYRSQMETTVDGGIVKILKGTEELFTGVSVAEGDNIFEGMDVPVNEGDMIFFVFDGKDAPNASFSIDTLRVELN